MKKIILTASVVALAVAAPVAAQATAEVPADKVLAYSNAGIALALPKGFEYQLLTDPSNIVRAIRKIPDQGPMIVAVLAIPVESNVTANAYANITEARSKKSPNVKGLEVLKRTAIPIAGLTGTARLISFVSGDRPTTALRAYFVRDIKKYNLHICYVLTVTAPTQQQQDALRVFGAIVKSIKLIELEPPSATKIDGPGPKATDQRRGYSIRVPHRWQIRSSPTGAELLMTDYTTGGRTTLVANITVASIGRRTDATAAGLKLAEVLKRYFETRENLTTKPLSQSRTKMAGFDAHQLVLQQTPKQPSKADPSAKVRKPQVVVQRTICAVAGEQGEEGPQRNSYALTVFVGGRDTKAAVAVMEKVAGGFAIIPPTIKPVIAPVPKTKPAATMPAKAPAATRPALAPATKPAKAPVATQPATVPVIKIKILP